MIKFIGTYPTKFEKSSPEEFLEWSKNKTELQVDTEAVYTAPKPPKFEALMKVGKITFTPFNSKLLCIQIGDGKDQWVMENYEFLKGIMEDKSICKVLTNAFFDLRYFLFMGWDVQNIYDCFAAEMILTLGKKMPEGYRGLEQMAQRYYGITLNKDVRDQIQERGLDDTVIQYAAEDVIPMSEIKIKQMEEISRLDLGVEVRRLNRFIITLARVSYKGFKIDVNKWMENFERNKVLLTEQDKKLNDYVVGLGWEEFIKDGKCNINWNSPKQVLKLFQKLGIYCLKKDKKTRQMKPSVEAKHLVRQKNKFPILPLYLKYKEINKEISTYGEEFIKENLSPDGKVHSEFFPIVDTGRISSSEPNIQNIPAKDDEGKPHTLRGCFIAEEGNVLVVADWAAQEPRITAEYSQDEFMIDFFLNGDGDPHNLVATAISSHLLGKEIKVTKTNNPIVEKYNKTIRDIGKRTNLGLDYGKSAFSLKDELEIEEKEAQAIIDALKAKTPQKQKYFDEKANFLKRHGYIIIDNVTKRRSYFARWDEYLRLGKMSYYDRTKEQTSTFYALRGDIERMAANYPIQGTGGSMSSIAAILFEDKVKEKGLNAWLVNLVHDELVAECPKEIGEDVKEVLVDCMLQAGQYFCSVIPMKVDSYVGDNWGIKA